MGIAKLITVGFKRFLPSPFTIAILLTMVTLACALIFGQFPEGQNRFSGVLQLWEKGIWNSGLLVFAYQMMLILVLGHVLVLSKPVERLILRLTGLVKNAAGAAAIVAMTTMFVSFFNWGLGLIFGAILARKVGEYAQENNIAINYPLIGACGYVGLMVWHGGISGSAPLKVAEEGHLNELMRSGHDTVVNLRLPESISTAETIFSPSNLVIFSIVVVVISALSYVLGRKAQPTKTNLKVYRSKVITTDVGQGADRLDRSRILAYAFGGITLLAFVAQYLPVLRTLNITPNLLNFFMFGLALVMHGRFSSFLHALDEAIKGTSGILIQFPLYFGIMGVMTGSGLIGEVSAFFTTISTTTSLPLFTFLSAGLVNIFVPSGGGQWAVQGPLVLESALNLGVPLPKAIMALAYGDQLTNMLQPFWALPLLGITKLKAREILPYTVLFMLVGAMIYLLGLLFF